MIAKKLILAAVFLVPLIILTSLLGGCGKALLTGRQQLLLVSDSDINELGAQQYAEILSKAKLIRDTADYQRVVRVGNRIAGAVDDFVRSQGQSQYTSGYQWEFNLIEDNSAINAFCLPGGKIAVYTGLLPVTRDDNGLAVVLSHEIAHALAKHGNERLSQILLAQYGGAKLSEAIKNNPTETQNNIMLAFGLGANVGVLLPYNRLQESEADRIGLSIMAYAGYDPHAALNFWARMEKLETAGPPEFLSTHPLSSGRINDIKAEIPEAMKYYRSYK
ncbi:MAG: M48 family metallopeptidase [Candidatus Margulisiibacteriota bacterium]